MNVTVDKSGRPLLSMRFEGHGLDEARYEALSTREQLTMSLEPVFKEVLNLCLKRSIAVRLT